MATLVKILFEGCRVAFLALWSNRLRTFLSLFGIAVGIFSMIAVLSLIGSMENTIRKSFSRLGSDTVFIMRESWSEDPGMNWWKYVRRPLPKYSEFERIRKGVSSVDAISMRVILVDQLLKNKGNNVGGLMMAAGTHDFGNLFDFDIEKGRYFTEQESQRGANYIILGATLAEELFPSNSYPIGEKIKWQGKKVTLIGVLKKEGSSLLGDGFDKLAMLPLNYFRKYKDIDADELMPLIAVRPKKGIASEQMEDELRAVLRSSRSLRPGEEDNFEFNRLSILDGLMDAVFIVIYLAGLVIGSLSILVGAFGIANIMFVSVKERTRLIGIKKAMGAKSYHIMLEFLVEAILLTLTGGFIGLFMVFAGIMLFNWYFESFDAYMSLSNILIGLFVSITVGIISGIVPAWLASDLDPVEAMRQ